MSDANGMTDERAALMLELLGTIVGRFDRVDKGLVAVGKIAAQKPKVEQPAPGGLSTMREDDLRILIRETAAVGAEIGMRESMIDLENKLYLSISNAAGGDIRTVRSLLEHSEAQTAQIRQWGLVALCGALMFGFALGNLAQIVVW